MCVQNNGDTYFIKNYDLVDIFNIQKSVPFQTLTPLPYIARLSASPIVWKHCKIFSERLYIAIDFYRQIRVIYFKEYKIWNWNGTERQQYCSNKKEFWAWTA